MWRIHKQTGPPVNEEKSEQTLNPIKLSVCRRQDENSKPSDMKHKRFKPHLHLHTQIVNKVSREGQTVDRGQYCIDPTWGETIREEESVQYLSLCWLWSLLICYLNKCVLQNVI